jgi:hypothetical protein
MLVTKLQLTDVAPLALDLVVQVARQKAQRFSKHKKPFTVYDTDEPASSLSLLIDACMMLSKRAVLHEGVEHFSNAILRLGAAWPGADGAIKNFLGILYRITRRENNGPIWNASLHFRASA